ncbi:UNVERIFIED_CONTAM: hypothetical protein K2H54_052141 [Gekko kuhli]
MSLITNDDGGGHVCCQDSDGVASDHMNWSTRLLNWSSSIFARQQKCGDKVRGHTRMTIFIVYGSLREQLMFTMLRNRASLILIFRFLVFLYWGFRLGMGKSQYSWRWRLRLPGLQKMLSGGLGAFAGGTARTDRTDSCPEWTFGSRAEVDRVGSKPGTGLGGTEMDNAFSQSKAFSHEVLSDRALGVKHWQMTQVLTLWDSPRHMK